MFQPYSAAFLDRSPFTPNARLQYCKFLRAAVFTRTLSTLRDKFSTLSVGPPGITDRGGQQGDRTRSFRTGIALSCAEA